MSGQLAELSERDSRELYVAERWDVDVDAIRGAGLSDLRVKQAFDKASGLNRLGKAVLSVIGAGVLAVLGLAGAAAATGNEDLTGAAVVTGIVTFLLGGASLGGVRELRDEAKKDFEAELERKTPSAVSEKNVISPP